MSDAYKGRVVTERDFRMPEFQNADPADYEFRDDGKVVRKDRWQSAILSIAAVVGVRMRGGFEIHDVVRRVEEVCDDLRHWNRFDEEDDEALTDAVIRLVDGSILTGASYDPRAKTVNWRGITLSSSGCTHWRHEPLPDPCRPTKDDA